MKVLLWTRPKDGIGGDFIQVDSTAHYLRELGIEVDVSDKYRLSSDEISKYDIIHLFVINLPNIEEKVEMCRRCNKPCVMSPLYRDPKYGE